MAGEDSEGAIDLLRQHHPCEFVRQCNSAKGEKHLRPFTRCGRPPICRTNGQHNPLLTFIAQPCQHLGELFRRERFATGVEQDNVGACPSFASIGPTEEGLFVAEGKLFNCTVTYRPLDILRRHAPGSGGLWPSTSGRD